MESQKNSNSQSNPEKEEQAGVITLSEYKLCTPMP